MNQLSLFQIWFYFYFLKLSFFYCFLSKFSILQSKHTKLNKIYNEQLKKRINYIYTERVCLVLDNFMQKKYDRPTFNCMCTLTLDRFLSLSLKNRVCMCIPLYFICLFILIQKLQTRIFTYYVHICIRICVCIYI